MRWICSLIWFVIEIPMSRRERKAAERFIREQYAADATGYREAIRNR